MLLNGCRIPFQSVQSNRDSNRYRALHAFFNPFLLLGAHRASPANRQAKTCVTARGIFAQMVSGCCVFLLISVPLSSQSTSGRILGTVSDQAGSAIAGATVTITDTARGITRSLTTDDAGAYSAPNLVPGTYTVRAQSQGFSIL